MAAKQVRKINSETRIKIAHVVQQNISLSIVDAVVIVDFDEVSKGVFWSRMEQKLNGNTTLMILAYIPTKYFHMVS